MGLRYNNYHKHTHYSNVKVKDCVSKPIDYINRAKELGHTTYFTTEHGYAGHVFEAFKLCHENGLKCVFSVEAYYVDDMYDKTSRKNYHICLIAMTNKGRRAINTILSKAETEGFYYQPRIDLECLLSLPKDDVVVTTACIATRMFKQADWYEKFFMPCLNHFGKNFYLEIQDHDDEQQKQLNLLLYDLSLKYNVELIHGCDSHYIYPQDSIYRDKYIAAKRKTSLDIESAEDTFILDYPSYEQIVERYKKQGVLPQEAVEKALSNTLIFDNAEEPDFDFEFKLPKLFKDKDSNELLSSILLEKFKEKYFGKPLAKYTKEYISQRAEAMKYELDIIHKCNMEDYFIIDYYVVKKAVEDYGAVITRTGRGSAVSFYVNYLLGFTKIDRLDAPIKLYPTRFMSAERILNSRSLPD